MAARAGWYKDPSGRYRARYWDGASWTREVRDLLKPEAGDGEGSPSESNSAASDEAVAVDTPVDDTARHAPSGLILASVGVVAALMVGAYLLRDARSDEADGASASATSLLSTPTSQLAPITSIPLETVQVYDDPTLELNGGTYDLDPALVDSEGYLVYLPIWGQLEFGLFEPILVDGQPIGSSEVTATLGTYVLGSSDWDPAQYGEGTQLTVNGRHAFRCMADRPGVWVDDCTYGNAVAVTADGCYPADKSDDEPFAEMEEYCGARYG